MSAGGRIAHRWLVDDLVHGDFPVRVVACPVVEVGAIGGFDQNRLLAVRLKELVEPLTPGVSGCVRVGDGEHHFRLTRPNARSGAPSSTTNRARPPSRTTDSSWDPIDGAGVPDRALKPPTGALGRTQRRPYQYPLTTRNIPTRRVRYRRGSSAARGPGPTPALVALLDDRTPARPTSSPCRPASCSVTSATDQAARRPKGARHPTLGNRVVDWRGATVLGLVTIGADPVVRVTR
jgi:hypothetical protein